MSSRGGPDQGFPRGLYSQGTGPDARFSLANERTLLAWMCTSLAIVAATLTAGGVVLGIALLAVGMFLWRRDLSFGIVVCSWSAPCWRGGARVSRSPSAFC